MKLVSFEGDNAPKMGVLIDEAVVDLGAAWGRMGVDYAFADMRALLDAGQAGLDKVATAVSFATKNKGDLLLDLETITFLPPILRPGKIICLGRNYAGHAKEGNAKVPDYPMLFHKPASSLLGHQGTIIIPPITNKVDYEGELAVVIGKTCKQVAAEDALTYVAGYMVAIDVSARDLQRRTSQFTAGKMLDTFGPMGPALTTKDEIVNPNNLHIQTRLNDRIMQDDNTRNMIFDIPFTISYISQIATLEVGDIILTGTPEGVGFPRNPPVFLQEGDTITVEIEGLGILSNAVAKQR